MENQPAVQIKNLTKMIGKKKIIDNITLDIFPGEILGFLGPNGAGKTTTIRMLVGLMSITAGDVIIKGLNLRKNFQQAILHVGGIVENPEMYKYLTGYQNLIHYARMVKGVGKSRIEELIKLVGLENRIHDKVRTYSLGMRQRLGVAQALLHSPSLLILDEPTNGLDPAGIREFRNYLRKLTREEGISVMVSSHLLSEMELMCDRIAIIQQGKLKGVHSIKDFVQDDQNLNVRFEVEPVSEAKAILEETFPELLHSVNGDNIEVILEREQIPAAIQHLIKKGIKIYGIQTTSMSLEDKFLEVTGGESIA